MLELEGDIARAKGMNGMAERLYRQAFQADRGNARLEEKFATALLKTHQHEYAALPDDSTWSDRVQRNPAASGVMSTLLPGLGQFHNGDFLKGAAIVFAWALLLMLIVRGPYWYALDLMKAGSRDILPRRVPESPLPRRQYSPRAARRGPLALQHHRRGAHRTTPGVKPLTSVIAP